MKFRAVITRTVEYSKRIEVEAEDANQAMDKAHQFVDDLSVYEFEFKHQDDTISVDAA